MMVTLVRKGAGQREVARRFGVGAATVHRWVARAGEERLSRVDFGTQKRGPRRPANRTAAPIERRVLDERTRLKTKSVLGECGARAIREELTRKKVADVPSVRTIGRILKRHGAVDGCRRVRYPAPPPGWYLPEVFSGRAELDSFDIVEGLSVRGQSFDVFNAISLRGALPASFPMTAMTAKTILPCIQSHWSEFGLPGYAQFDNDMRFQGPHNRPGLLGRIIRLCLALHVIAVFAPSREMGFQASIERYNGQWQTSVWRRFTHTGFAAFVRASDRYVKARRDRHAQRIERAPERAPYPPGFALDLQHVTPGTIIFIRRTDDEGRVTVLERPYVVDRHWIRRLVRCEVDLARHRIDCYALHRRAPENQPLRNRIPCVHPSKPFHE